MSVLKNAERAALDQFLSRYSEGIAYENILDNLDRAVICEAYEDWPHYILKDHINELKTSIETVLDKAIRVDDAKKYYVIFGDMEEPLFTIQLGLKFMDRLESALKESYNVKFRLEKIHIEEGRLYFNVETEHGNIQSYTGVQTWLY